MVKCNAQNVMLVNMDRKEYLEMHFGTDKCNGIIVCPMCDVKYSVLSPIYRHFGIPKRIETTIEFEQNGVKLYYYLCTYVDLIHLCNGKEQKELLTDFDYNDEDTLIHLLSKPKFKKINEQKSKYYMLFDGSISDDESKPHMSMEDLFNYIMESR